MVVGASWTPHGQKAASNISAGGFSKRRKAALQNNAARKDPEKAQAFPLISLNTSGGRAWWAGLGSWRRAKTAWRTLMQTARANSVKRALYEDSGVRPPVLPFLYLAFELRNLADDGRNLKVLSIGIVVGQQRTPTKAVASGNRRLLRYGTEHTEN